MTDDIRYDTAAADDLASKLRQLADKLSGLAGLRSTDDSTYLQDSWTGKKRDDFVTTFTQQQTSLRSLADRALTLRGQVNDATDAAEKARTPLASQTHHM
jgi:uncharacterized protein YukE